LDLALEEVERPSPDPRWLIGTGLNFSLENNFSTPLLNFCGIVGVERNLKGPKHSLTDML
jgi:hypothetical protein